jgi:glucosylceramidase
MLHKFLPSLLLTALSVTGAVAQNAAKPASNFKAYSVAGKKAQVYATVAGSDQRLATGSILSFQPSPQPLETQVCVFVDPTKTFQTMLGIGGALTDAAAETYAKLSKEQQQEFMQAYYSPTKGIGYTLARTTIASSDFSTAPYDYIADKDESLKTFSVKHDEQYRIPFIKQAIAAAGGKLTMYVAPWSPPAWMKDNSNRLKGGKLLPQYRQTWADHYVKFIKEYERQGIPIWGLSTQNEPMAVQKWESCLFTATEERDFIKEYLGPTLKKSGLGDRKLIAWDHNRDQVYQRASTILDDPKAAQYVWGVGYHWYETWTGSTMMFDNVRRVHETYPNMNLLLTEA